MDHRQIKAQEIMKETLGEDYLSLRFVSFQCLEADDEEKASHIVAKILRSDQEEPIALEGNGVGSLDAFFLALRERFGREFPSVNAIVFSSIKAQNVADSTLNRSTDAEAEVHLRIRNSYDDEIEFVNRSRSLLRAALEGLLQSVEYFVNSERTYIKLYKVLEHYKKEGRSDLIDKYTSLLSIMVRNTSYAEVIELIKADGKN